jgi:hypothetical protein
MHSAKVNRKNDKRKHHAEKRSGKQSGKLIAFVDS